MNDIKTEIVRDENGHPIAVQIPYADWVELKYRIASMAEPSSTKADIGKYFGKIKLHEDPVEYQEQARGEWR